MKLYLSAITQIGDSNFETLHLIGGSNGPIYTKFEPNNINSKLSLKVNWICHRHT